MLMSAKKTGNSELLIFILELLSEVKSDGHKILSGALVYGDLGFMESCMRIIGAMRLRVLSARESDWGTIESLGGVRARI